MKRQEAPQSFSLTSACSQHTKSPPGDTDLLIPIRARCPHVYEDPDHHALSNTSSAYRRYPQGDLLDKGSNLSVSFHGLPSEISIKRTTGCWKHNRIQDMESIDGHRKFTHAFMCSGASDVSSERYPGYNIRFILHFSVFFLLQSLSAALMLMV